ncbi:unnamed protein product [Protopolystoma xenopodis]|uniref:ATP-dependent rRNA helicase SPB4-like C-terminal extension domain-containing protein n=1 Tax=Protopolystoma xenopodis TaxID=117903 RepID=A0A448XQB2_9PLAT|nr:unnamed protein product [Protopolystoma xenopodis]
MLVLRPHELEFLGILKTSRVKVVEYEVATSKLADVQPALEKLVSSNYFLSLSAQEAFKSLVRAYASSSLACFNVGQLDLSAVAKNFGLSIVPMVDLNVHASKQANFTGRKRYKPSFQSEAMARKSKIYKKVR